MQAPTARATRVIKKLDPSRPGARRWAQDYGDALVCVRYRIDGARQERLTTVEIVVDRAPTLASMQVGLRIAREELEMRQAVKAAGGRWDPAAKLWQLPLGVARQLGLASRIVGRSDES